MTCKAKRFACGRIIASTRSNVGLLATIVVVGLALISRAPAEPVDPEVGRMLDRALQEAESFRKQLPILQYDTTMRVQEWDGRGHLRGTARATAIVRPGDKRPMTFLSREIEGKVRFPDDKENKKEDDEKEVTLPQFAADHHIAERFEFNVTGTDDVAGERARRIDFKPRPHQPEKNTADRFLDAISGTAWVSESRNKLVKFDMHLTRPFQLLWIFAVLKDLSIQYELITPDEILGHAKLKVLFALTTPVYSIRQQHDVDISNFCPREAIAGR
ncbi:MAG: hypothetical protein M3Y69_05755 [Verrucomicrobiota bacterium]|nr:hypothetical protein [Verrucomicrobiota bacterium]